MGKSATIDAGQEQHLQALEYANRVRLARARMKRRIAAGELLASEVVLSCPWQAHSMSVSDLLMSQKRWGRARCRRLLVSRWPPCSPPRTPRQDHRPKCKPLTRRVFLH